MISFDTTRNPSLCRFHMERVTELNIFTKKMCLLYFTFAGNIHRYETCWYLTNHATLTNIPTFWTQKYDRFGIRASAIRSWNSAQDLLKRNLPLKNSTPKSIKYFLTKYFIESY